MTKKKLAWGILAINLIAVLGFIVYIAIALNAWWLPLSPLIGGLMGGLIVWAWEHK